MVRFEVEVLGYGHARGEALPPPQQEPADDPDEDGAHEPEPQDLLVGSPSFEPEPGVQGGELGEAVALFLAAPAGFHPCLADPGGPAALAGDFITRQRFKLFVGTYVPLERDVLHLVFGALIVGAALLARRFGGLHHPMRWALWISFVAGIAMEVLDRRDDIAWLGYWRWGESLSELLGLGSAINTERSFSNCLWCQSRFYAANNVTYIWGDCIMNRNS